MNEPRITRIARIWKRNRGGRSKFGVQRVGFIALNGKSAGQRRFWFVTFFNSPVVIIRGGNLNSASSKSRRPVTLSAFLTERQFLAEQFTDLGRRTGSPSLADHSPPGGFVQSPV